MAYLVPMTRNDRLPLAASAEAPSRFIAAIAPANAPEIPLVVEFVGISCTQQRAALEGFPGGRRFVLADGAPNEKRALH